MTEKQKELVEQYQCPGCVNGCDIKCFEKTPYDIDSCKNDWSCYKHHAGTSLLGRGSLYLGLPIGFNRLGRLNSSDMSIQIFNSEASIRSDKFNIPVWKYLDEHGNTLVRGLSPRINQPFIDIYEGDRRSEIDCLEISSGDIEKMD